MKIKLYKVNIYQAYRADECGIRWFTFEPKNSTYYKYEILEVIEKDLPEGITYNDFFRYFEYDGHECQMVTKKDGSVILVSSERIIKWF